MDKSCYSPEAMNIELTTNCPLRCPQCYCSLTGGKNIDPDVAKYWIKQGAQAGVKEVYLSGGETLCYPHLYEIIHEAHIQCGSAAVALSGYHFGQEEFDKMVASGIDEIFISLNGSTSQINCLTRDGYDLAISALKLLQKNNYTNTTINWVMHANNADDFPNLVALAEQYSVAHVFVIGVKPDSKKSMNTMPSISQIKNVCQFIKTYHGKVKIFVESCFSPMLAHLHETKLFGNMNVGKHNGCDAGKYNFNVSVDGLLSPCRHLEIYEKYDSLDEYWTRSKTLQRLREIDNESRTDPCNSCKYEKYCRPCAAISYKVENKLYRGHKYCTAFESK